MTADRLPVQSSSSTSSFDALVIGAGLSGLYQLHCLRDRLGLSVKVLEAADGVGGTWYWNRYPGARCDSESHSYGYAFSDELMREWEWSERFPAQPEVLRYINYAADKLDLKRDVQFNTRVSAAHYDDAANRWQVRTESGELFSAKFLITAVGCLSSTNVPKIAGLESFSGQWHHTGMWPQQGVDFTGKRVGLIGTGSTGIQAIPEIAQSAAHLFIFQRSPTYSVPAGNHPLTPEFKRYVKEHVHEIRQAIQSTTTGHPFANSERLAAQTPAPERQAVYEAAWQKGGLQFRATFGDLLLSKEANDSACAFVRGKIHEIVKDPETARKLSAVDHPYATKRPPIDTDYYETFNRDNVSLVDVRAAPIEQITPIGIRTRDAQYPLDIIVFATGFDALTGPLLKMDIRGRGGRKLAEDWQSGPRSYLGLQIAGFPNLFTITGPGSPSVLVNMPVAIEQHVEWITDCIEHMRANGLHRVEAKTEAMTQWQTQVDEAASVSLLSHATTSWYHGANIPGKPKVFMPYAGGMVRYREICAQVAANNYEGFSLSA